MMYFYRTIHFNRVVAHQRFSSDQRKPSPGQQHLPLRLTERYGRTVYICLQLERKRLRFETAAKPVIRDLTRYRRLYIVP